ncbi:MFS transporter [Pyrinomonas sp.]|uniref:MFS transporter n=1 Tax=Pyrinomonas sp. TaxID=2080306 RepID=UPI00332D9CC2
MTYRQLLRANLDLRRLWTAQVVSEIGDWLNNISVFALTLELAGPGREGVAIATYAVARHLPLFFFGPFAGVTVDRADRKRVMIAADLARALLALGFVLAANFRSLTLIYLVSAALFSVAAFFNAAKRASIPQLAHNAEELIAANALSASTTAATLAIGSAFGGMLAAVFERQTIFVLNAATFLASALIVRRLSLSQALRRQERELIVAWQRPLEDFREGLRYVRSRPLLLAVLIVVAGWGLGNGAARALYSVFGAHLGQSAHLTSRPSDFGISVLFVAMGVGGVLGAILARRSESALTTRLGRSLALDGAALVAFSVAPNLWSAAAVLVVREANYAIWWTAQQTILMQATDVRFGGRVFASHETITTLAMLGSMLVSGVAADRFGMRPVASSAGIVIIASSALWFLLVRQRQSAVVNTASEDAGR